MADKHPGGAPTKCTPEVLEKVKQFYDAIEPWYEVPIEKQDKEGNVTTTMQRQANVPPAKKDLAKHLGVCRDTIYNWLNPKKESYSQEFFDILKARDTDTLQMLLMQNGLLGNYNATFAIFAAKNMLGWTDKTETKSEVTVNLPKEITINLVRPK